MYNTKFFNRHFLNSTNHFQVYVGALSLHYEALSVEASKQTTADEIVSCIVERLGLTVSISFVYGICDRDYISMYMLHHDIDMLIISMSLHFFCFILFIFLGLVLIA